MTSLAEEYEREQRRIAPFQERPEFSQWLSLMDRRLDEFLTMLSLSENAFSITGLRRVETFTVDSFPDGTAASAACEADDETADRIARFYGEVFCRSFDGRWLFVDVAEGSRPLRPVVIVPGHAAYHDPWQQIVNAASKRTGDRWERIFNRVATKRAAWVQAGRPPMAEWFQTGLAK